MVILRKKKAIVFTDLMGSSSFCKQTQTNIFDHSKIKIKNKMKPPYNAKNKKRADVRDKKRIYMNL